MSKKHRRSKKKTKVINQTNNITPVISKKIEKKDETSLQELIKNNNINNETIKKDTDLKIKEVTKKETPLKKDSQPIKLKNKEIEIKLSDNQKITPNKKDIPKQITKEDKKTNKEQVSKEKQKEILEKPILTIQETVEIKEINQPPKEEIIIETIEEKQIDTSQVTKENPEKEELVDKQIINNKNNFSKIHMILILFLIIILTGLIIFLVYSSINYYQLIDDNNQLLQEITITNNEITKNENNNQEITNKINETEKTLKDKIKEYNVWLKLKETIEKALS